MLKNDTIIALATPSGMGAIAVIRLSGPESISLVNRFFKSKFGKKNLTKVKSHTIHLGTLQFNKQPIDEVLISVFKNPHSYTGEDVVEVNCHGSVYIQQEIIQGFLKNGIRHANPGEFTLRAFLNGKMDLSQAEAVADLIASNSKASHDIALQQMRSGFSQDIETLRQQLLNFASLIELELDFAEEDVAFANRDDFQKLIHKLNTLLKKLIDSFALGNVLKNGIPVAIVGEPNVGKSTLLNTLLNEERAIVSHIEGTTRDTIEDELIINGINYRFIDTAGIRSTKDVVESIGIKKTFEKINQAQLVIYLIDLEKVSNNFNENLSTINEAIKNLTEKYQSKKILIVANKVDKVSNKIINQVKKELNQFDLLFISAKNKIGIDHLINKFTELANIGALSNNELIVSNSRHFEALTKAHQAIIEIQKGIESQLSTDLLAIDIREALYQLGLITGKITNEDLLGNIFANFCIGK
ncbi:MAG: tRNA uridine-5-carboxymethylaminomethyl(34) synthesis GTPase MnmE [Lutibacter sp.]